MIVVGYTGEKESIPALEVAARLSARTGVPVKVVTAFDAPTMDLGLYTVTGPPTQEQVERWRAPSTREAEEIARSQGAIQVESEVVLGTPTSALLRAATPEDVLVVGHRGHGEVAAALLGSVAFQVSAYAPCPVVVIGKQAHTTWTGPFVVGVDGSAGSRHAASVAADWALRHDLPLVVAAAWQDEVLVAVGDTWSYGPMQDDDDALENATRAMVEEIAADLRTSHPTVEVTTRIERGDPAHVLIEVAKDATALFTGSRGRGGFTGLMLGSVTHQLILRAGVPIVVAR